MKSIQPVAAFFFNQFEFFIAYRLDGRYHDTFSCEKKMLVFSAPTLGSRRLMVGEASPSVFGCHP